MIDICSDKSDEAQMYRRTQRRTRGNQHPLRGHGDWKGAKIPYYTPLAASFLYEPLVDQVLYDEPLVDQVLYVSLPRAGFLYVTLLVVPFLYVFFCICIYVCSSIKLVEK